MGTKAVVDIDVRDQKFDRFNEHFKAYQEALAKTPGIWKDATKESEQLTSQFERMAAALLAQSHVGREIESEEKERLKRLTTTEQLWTSIGKSSSALAKNVLDVGAGLLKWGGFLAGGLIGDSLYGLDKLGSAAADQRRSSLGLGLSVGEQQAFGTNFERFVDPHAFLSGINNATSNVAMQGPLYGLGVNPNQGTSDVAIDTLKKVRALALGTPINQLGLLESSRHLDQLGISTEDLRRLRSTSPGEFNRQLSHYKTDVGALGFNDRTGQAWQDFTTQMERAGQTIFKVLTQRLVPLAGPLTNLSDSVVHVIERFADGGAISTAIKDMAGYLDKFNGVIGKPEFLQKIETFASDVGVLGDAVHTVADAVEHPGAALGKAVMSDLTTHQVDRFNAIKSLFSSGWGALMRGAQGITLSNLDKNYGLPAGALEAIYARETSSGRNVKDQPGKDGAQGPFQIKPSQGVGIDRHGFDSSAHWAAKRFSDELRHYHGDALKAMAAYHLGDGALDALIKKFGNQWASHVPYVSNVKIENNTGGNAIVSASQLTQ